MFDCVGGTSIGGIIALGVTGKKYTYFLKF